MNTASHNLTKDMPVFAALADPMRRNLLVHLAEHSPKTATQLAAFYPITRQGILEQWLKDLTAKWDERLLRLKTMLEDTPKERKQKR